MLLQDFLADIAMMIHFQFLKPLTQKLRLSRPIKNEKRHLYIKYSMQLVNLRKALQKFVGPFYFLRITFDIGLFISTSLIAYWKSTLFLCLSQLVFVSNGIRMLKIASSVYEMEVRIVDSLYDRELFDISIKSNTKRNLSLLKVSAG